MLYYIYYNIMYVYIYIIIYIYTLYIWIYIYIYMHISSIKPLLAMLHVNCAFWVLNKTFRLLLAWRGNLLGKSR